MDLINYKEYNDCSTNKSGHKLGRVFEEKDGVKYAKCAKCGATGQDLFKPCLT